MMAGWHDGMMAGSLSVQIPLGSDPSRFGSLSVRIPLGSDPSRFGSLSVQIPLGSDPSRRTDLIGGERAVVQLHLVHVTVEASRRSPRVCSGTIGKSGNQRGAIRQSRRVNQAIGAGQSGNRGGSIRQSGSRAQERVGCAARLLSVTRSSPCGGRSAEIGGRWVVETGHVGGCGVRAEG